MIDSEKKTKLTNAFNIIQQSASHYKGTKADHELIAEALGVIAYELGLLEKNPTKNKREKRNGRASRRIR